MRPRWLYNTVIMQKEAAALSARSKPMLGGMPLFIFREHKNRAPKSPVFAVKFSYATNKNPTGRLYPIQILLSNQTSF
jgi:hypothetical protein